jgi:deoxyribonuclease V
MMICVDVDYRGDHAIAAGVLFHAWADETPVREIVERIDGIEPYTPGQFFRRELPCLRGLLARVGEPIDLVIVDGYVWLGDETRPGLGGHLYEALGRTTPVVGVAKTCFRSATLAVAVRRGERAKRPLLVTAAGIGVEEAARHVESMHGSHRVPTLLKRVDSVCREATRVKASSVPGDRYN